MGDLGLAVHARPPVAFAAVNGVLDQVLPYDGGPVDVAAPVATVQSVEEWTSQRARERGCGGPATTSPSPHIVATVWSHCTAPMQLYRLEDGGHTWPQSDGVGSIDQEFSVTELIASMLASAPSR